jgi:hypothetical protein
MKIRLLKPYQLSKKGDVIEPDESVAMELINRGIAEAVIDKGRKTK